MAQDGESVEPESFELPREDQHVQILAAASAKDFLDLLDPTHERWGGGFEKPWIFRGHGDSEWELMPRAWRRDGQKILRPHYEKYASAYKDMANKERQAKYWKAAQCEAVHRFTMLADELGLPIRGAVPSGVEYLSRKGMYADPVTQHESFALAQHYGVPTELLDWTRNPYIAGFFAAETTAELVRRLLPEVGPDVPDPGLPNHLAVWALDRSRLCTVDEMRYSQKGLKRILEVIEVPRSTHNFLHAQDGLFTWDPRGLIDYRGRGSWPTVDEIVGLMQGDDTEPLLRKVTLPVQEVGELLRLLWRRGVFRAKLMPTYDNVTASNRVRMALESDPWKCTRCNDLPEGFHLFCPNCHQPSPYI